MCFKANTLRVHKYNCVVMALRVVLVVPRLSANTNKNSNMCGVIMAARAVGESGGIADGMSTEGSMALVGRKPWARRWYVHGWEYGSGREEAEDEQMACPQKGAWLWLGGIVARADGMSSEGSRTLGARKRSDRCAGQAT